MGIVETVKKGFSIASQCKLLMAVVAAIFVLFNIATSPINSKLQAMTGELQKTQNPDPKLLLPIIPLTLLVFALNLLVSAFINAGFWSYIRDKYKIGSVALGAFFSSSVKYFGKIFLLNLLLIAFMVAVVAVVIAVFMAGALIAGAFKGTPALSTTVLILTGLGSLTVVGFGVYYGLMMFSFAPIVAIADDTKVIESVKKSAVFFRKNLMSLLGVGAIYLGINLLGLGAFLLVIFLESLATGGRQPGPMMVIAFFVPLIMMMLAFLYIAMSASASFMGLYLNSSNSNNTTGA